MSIIERESGFYLVKRVPVRFHKVEERRQVWLALNTDSKKVAEKKAPSVWDEMILSWEARAAGDTTESEARYSAAREIAKSYGLRYLPMSEVVELPLDEVAERLDATFDKRGRPQMQVAEALLGNAPLPVITLSKALELYWPMAKGKIRGKSKDQVRRWQNPRKKAFKNFIQVLGDIPIDRITPDDMLEFQAWWNDRIDTEGLTPNSANKDFIHLAAVLREVNKGKKLGLNMPLTGYTIEDTEERTRPAFSTEWITDKILEPGALSGLNKDARCILVGMINTGFRPSEVECMTGAQIRLDCDIPHISIEPIGRTLKSKYARRLIPLLGVSLEAFKECPDGFPRYRDTAGCSNAVNKFLLENGLRPSKDHVMYSLRHSFQERMLKAKVDDRVRRELFGHRLTEDKYGEIELDVLRDALLPVAL